MFVSKMLAMEFLLFLTVDVVGCDTNSLQVTSEGSMISPLMITGRSWQFAQCACKSLYECIVISNMFFSKYNSICKINVRVNIVTPKHSIKKTPDQNCLLWLNRCCCVYRRRRIHAWIELSFRVVVLVETQT